MNKNFAYKIIDDQEIAIFNSKAFEGLKKAGLLAYKTLEHVSPFVKEGVTTKELNDICHDFIIKNNAIPAPLGYNGYPASICTSLNNEICHGIPSDKKLIDGDIINIDVTVVLDGWYGDTSKMFAIGNISAKAKRLMEVTKLSLDAAIEIAKPGCTLGDIGAIIQEIAHKNNFSVVEEFCGHGIGNKFHMNPNILHFGKKGEGIVLEEGMVFTIEPMLNAGKKFVRMLNNQWTAVTKDFSLSAQYEHTIGITKNGNIIFTKP